MAQRIQLTHDHADDRTLKALDAIERRRALARAQVPEGYEAYFQDQARFLSAHTTVSIEGNRLDFQSVQLVLLEEPVDDPSRREAKNAVEAYDFANSIAADPTLEVDSGLIRTFNSILLKGLPGQAAQNRGAYRKGGAMIQDTVSGQINYLAPPPEWVADLMRSLQAGMQQWLQQDPPEIAAAKAHFGLISIHPFADGNGRTARLVADLILNMSQRSADGMLSVSGVLLKRREEYYQALRDSQGADFQEQVDVTAFVRFHTEALASAVTELEQRTAALAARRRLLEQRFADLLHTRRLIGLLYLYDVGPLSTSAYASFTDCSQPTALADLNELTRAGIVERAGRASATRYALMPAVRAQLDDSV